MEEEREKQKSKLEILDKSMVFIFITLKLY